ncbi:hypothetical protein BDN70DRAFT_209473 [Pholiota conissans]|uniref:Uncharacterized protein n=1 Tax=Pholiota conissans TaxID=109636 RepID=A0A9P5YW54_9AGAR|nr:hypothetical protein BDN70DRAFT_209473 [Pholiota conissans]
MPLCDEDIVDENVSLCICMQAAHLPPAPSSYQRCAPARWPLHPSLDIVKIFTSSAPPRRSSRTLTSMSLILPNIKLNAAPPLLPGPCYAVPSLPVLAPQRLLPITFRSSRPHAHDMMNPFPSPLISINRMSCARRRRNRGLRNFTFLSVSL